MVMGTLTPGATYIYERIDNKIYAREFGSSERKLVGYDAPRHSEFNREKYFTLWNEIFTMAETDSEIKELLDKVVILYNLKKT